VYAVGFKGTTLGDQLEDEKDEDEKRDINTA
jgi:hypothetical protein